MLWLAIALFVMMNLKCQKIIYMFTQHVWMWMMPLGVQYQKV